MDRIVQAVLEGREVFALHEDLPEQRFEKIESGYALKLQLPFVEKGAVQLHESGTDIILKTGNFKRCIPRPDTLRNYAVTGAKLSEGTLTINFTQGGASS